MTNSYAQFSPVPVLTRVTRALIIACVTTYFIDFFFVHLGFTIGDLLPNEILGIVPSRIYNNYWVWQFFTYIFMHGHPLHLLLNMLILWFFGSEIEMRMGEKRFLFYFFLCGVGAGLFNYAVNAAFLDVSKLDNPIIGASGAIFGILAAYGIFFGERYMLVFFLFPMKAKYFVLIMAAIELVTGVQSSAHDNVAHFAHLGGMGVGGAYLYFRYIRPKGGGKSQKDYERERLKKQFTLIVNESKGQRSDDDPGPYWH